MRKNNGDKSSNTSNWNIPHWLKFIGICILLSIGALSTLVAQEVIRHFELKKMMDLQQSGTSATSIPPLNNHTENNTTHGSEDDGEHEHEHEDGNSTAIASGKRVREHKTASN